MIENNEQLQKLLNENSIQTNFAEAVQYITKTPDYSKGQKYYEYYYQALQENIIRLLKTKKTDINEADIRKL